MEKLLQYAWQHKLYPAAGLKDTAGNAVKVLSPGWLNPDAGPDFFNAKIIINGQEWVGNVEVHMKSSDWYRHDHHHNPAYDSVILHVVEQADREVTRQDGGRIPQLVLDVTRRMEEFQRRMESSGGEELPCKDIISELPKVYVTDWLTTLGYERLYGKCDRLEKILAATGNDWEQAMYITFARALGFGKNSDQFERLARSMPLAYLRKHRDSVEALEAMLFGQATLLDDVPSENGYAGMLQREYMFYARKFNMERGDIKWQAGRMRPQNQPHRRIAMLAAVLHRRPNLFSDVLGAAGADDYRELFDVELQPYWNGNYNFNTWNEGGKQPVLSAASVNSLIINAVVPLLHSYGTLYGKPEMREKGIELLEQLPAERNAQVNRMRQAGLPCDNSFDSQACLQLRREYCENRKCLRCRVGARRFLMHNS